MAKSGGLTLLNIIHKIISFITDVKSIKQNPELRANSKKYGVLTIVYSLLGALLFVAMVGGTKWAFGLFYSGDAATIFFGLLVVILFLATDVVMAFYFLVYPLMTMIAQLTMNKKPITWVALGVWLVYTLWVVYNIVTLLAGTNVFFPATAV